MCKKQLLTLPVCTDQTFSCFIRLPQSCPFVIASPAILLAVVYAFLHSSQDLLRGVCVKCHLSEEAIGKALAGHTLAAAYTMSCSYSVAI